MSAGFPGVNSEFQELVKACAEAALETDDSELKTKVHPYHPAFLTPATPDTCTHRYSVSQSVLGGDVVGMTKGHKGQPRPTDPSALGPYTRETKLLITCQQCLS